ncbi:RNA polymerase sigma factor [uncultured Jatrophihabitans sp.]|uniref:RNA polymerase sigma factor n=1 Tax=uncultured Jatrophihabitans sp. TaxID=1610747 RepID=UPI0035C963DC
MSQGQPARDEVWFEQLYRTHHGAVLAYARRRVADADDVVAEVFSAAWRSRDRVPEPPLPWLYRTAANHVLHAHRARGRRDRLSVRATQLDTSASATDPADGVVARLDTSRRVESAFDRLSTAGSMTRRPAPTTAGWLPGSLPQRCSSWLSSRRSSLRGGTIATTSPAPAR